MDLVTSMRLTYGFFTIVPNVTLRVPLFMVVTF